MVVQHNISAMTANRYYGVNNKGLASSLEKLASGYAINKAGDNAAGLAVSEKMRAQIGGLTQASKNAEDGISLVQTMEGALQETDSILQRMRTLAVQSANGSYQDDVDREAMQLEFDQLNDELNQIADTDFNGTVMLNGGKMADGLKAVNGKFDYSKYDRDPKQLGSTDVTKVDSQAFDTKSATAGKITKADDVWVALNSGWTRADKDHMGPDSVDVTIKYNSNGNWTVEDATGGASKTAISVAQTDNGGVKLTAGSVDFANVVIDESNLKNGDTLTLTLNNPGVSKAKPTNAGATLEDTSNFTRGKAASAIDAKDYDIAVTIGGETGAKALTNADMTQAINDIYDALNGASLTATYTNSAQQASGAKLNGNTINASWTDIVLDADKGIHVYAKKAANSNDIYLSNTNDDAAANNFGLAKITLADNAGHDATGTEKGGSGDLTYSLGFENYAYSEGGKPTVEVKNPANGTVSKSNAFEQSKATMTYTDHLALQVGARTKDLVDFTFSYNSNGLGDLKANLNCSSRTDGLGTADLSISDQKSANDAIDKIDNAINKVNMVRATFGAAQNRIEHKINNIDTNTENLTAAESRIRDTQMDKEMMKFTSNQILSQASQSMLAQANSLPQGVLQLLG